jgi:hypothetical protein
MYFFIGSENTEMNTSPDGFVPLTSGGALSLMQNYSIEIHYPNGVVLKLPANTPVSLVRHYVGQ